MKIEAIKAVSVSVLLHNPHRLVNEKEYLDLFLNEVEKGICQESFWLQF